MWILFRMTKGHGYLALMSPGVGGIPVGILVKGHSRRVPNSSGITIQDAHNFPTDLQNSQAFVRSLNLSSYTNK